MKKLTLLSLFFYSTLSLAALNPNSSNSTPYHEFEAVSLSQTEKVIPKKQHEEDPAMHYEIDVIYPQIVGAELTPSAEIFNQQVHTLIATEIQQFKNSVKRDIPHMQTLPAEARHYSFKIDYDLDVVHPLSLVSVRLSLESSHAGRAHPYRAHRVFNYDLANNKELVLSDLFKPKSNYLQVLSEYSHKKLDETVGEKDKWMIAEGAKPLLKNFKNWNIAADSILITFDEYQVAPYTYGPQEVEIPFSELKNVLSPQAKNIASLDVPKTIG
jgi:hypothetical protein